MVVYVHVLVRLKVTHDYVIAYRESMYGYVARNIYICPKAMFSLSMGSSQEAKLSSYTGPPHQFCVVTEKGNDK